MELNKEDIVNNVTLIGNLTRDPEIREAGENKVAVLGIAETRESRDGEKTPQYYDVEVWGDLAINAAASLAKGDLVIAAGHLRYDEYEKDGQKRSKVKVVASHLGPSLRFAGATVVREAKVAAA
jgi:single-strand DNA-binding protein